MLTIVLMAEEEQDMRSLISRMEGYLNKKELELNVEKNKSNEIWERRREEKEYRLNVEKERN